MAIGICGNEGVVTFDNGSKWIEITRWVINVAEASTYNNIQLIINGGGTFRSAAYFDNRICHAEFKLPHENITFTGKIITEIDVFKGGEVNEPYMYYFRFTGPGNIINPNQPKPITRPSVKNNLYGIQINEDKE